MTYLVRENPETPCVRSHHPHRMICPFDDCGCEEEWDGRPWGPYSRLDCCVCGQEWPCAYRRDRD